MGWLDIASIGADLYGQYRANKAAKDAANASRFPI